MAGYVQYIRAKPGAKRRKSGTAAMWEDEAKDRERQVEGLSKRVMLAMFAREREMERQQDWDREHICTIHLVTLSRTGKCVFCELWGGPNK